MDAETIAPVMYSQEVLQVFSNAYRHYPVSVCSHVLEGGRVGVFGNPGSCWAAGCDQACLYGTPRTTIVAEHLTDRQVELATLFHLPVGAMAEHKDGHWELDRMAFYDDHFTKSSFNSLGRTRDVLENENGEFWVLAIGRHIEPTSLMSGGRFIPMFDSEAAIRDYRKRMLSFISRILLKATKRRFDEILKYAQSDGHNYLGIQHGPDQWETIIIEKVFDPEVNFIP